MKPRSDQNPVMTLDEVAEFLRVSNQVVEKEISSGKLPALVLDTEWRIVRKDFEQYLKVQTTQPKARKHEGRLPSITFSAAKPFQHRWPQRADKPKDPEQFDTAYGATVQTATGTKTIVIGFSYGIRKTNRRKATAFVDGRPMVRFKAADDFDRSGLMLSIIKTADRKQLRPDEPIPSEYAGFRVEQYRTYIDEAYNSKNMAVLCEKDDLQTMAAHALIRAAQVEERKAE